MHCPTENNNISTQSHGTSFETIATSYSHTLCMFFMLYMSGGTFANLILDELRLVKIDFC